MNFEKKKKSILGILSENSLTNFAKPKDFKMMKKNIVMEGVKNLGVAGHETLTPPEICKCFIKTQTCKQEYGSAVGLQVP